MNGFKEDLLNVVIREIEREWENGAETADLVPVVNASGLTRVDLEQYMKAHRRDITKPVFSVFSAIVSDAQLEQQKGGAL